MGVSILLLAWTPFGAPFGAPYGAPIKVLYIWADRRCPSKDHIETSRHVSFFTYKQTKEKNLPYMFICIQICIYIEYFIYACIMHMM